MTLGDISAYVCAESEVACHALKLTLGEIDCLKIVGIATDGMSGLEQIMQLKPDIALVSTYLPLMDGVEVIRHIKERCPSVKVIVIAHAGEDDAVAAALEAGAHASCYEPAFATLELLSAIHTALGSGHVNGGTKR